MCSTIEVLSFRTSVEQLYCEPQETENLKIYEGNDEALLQQSLTLSLLGRQESRRSRIKLGQSCRYLGITVESASHFNVTLVNQTNRFTAHSMQLW